MLFAQLAMVTHACTSDARAMHAGFPSFDAGPATAAMTVDPSADAAPIDAAQPNLCATHCQSAGQNVFLEPMAPPPFAPLAGYSTFAPVARGAALPLPFMPGLLPAPPADPPHATLHCCLRI